MDDLDHKWFTEAREQETNLCCTGQLRLTDWCPKWVRALGAHLLPEPCTLCDICVEKNAGNSPLGTGGWGTEGSQGAPPCWWGAWGAPVSAFGSLQRGGHWIQAGALRLRRILYFGLAHETECTRCPVHRPH